MYHNVVILYLPTHVLSSRQLPTTQCCIGNAASRGGHRTSPDPSQHSFVLFWLKLLHYICFLQSGQFSEDMIPTVGFNMRKISKGNVTIKLWDIGGQPRFRSMWERYCRGVNAIVWVSGFPDSHQWLSPIECLFCPTLCMILINMCTPLQYPSWLWVMSVGVIFRK